MRHPLEHFEEEVRRAKEKLTAAMRAIPPERVAEYSFRMAGTHASVTLSQLFGSFSDLVLIHNMGRKCVYCTLWADGFSSIYKHVANRCAFVLTTPDEPAVAGAFASARGWTFPVVSHAGTSFAKDMGYNPAPGDFDPGISGFRRLDDGGIVRTGTRRLGPGDDFCSVWPMFDLLQGGASGWEPKYSY